MPSLSRVGMGHVQQPGAYADANSALKGKAETKPGEHNKIIIAEQWWCTPLILALGRQRQVDL